MAGINKNEAKIFDVKIIDDAIDFIKENFGKLKEKFLEKRIEKEKNLNLKYKEDVENIIISMNQTADLIDESVFFNRNEYFNFLNIKEMIEYTLNNIFLFIEHYEFISGLLSDFKDIVKMKFKETENNYEKEYENYKYRFNRKKECFYTDIYKRSGEYDDLIEEFVNILGGD